VRKCFHYAGGVSINHSFNGSPDDSIHLKRHGRAPGKLRMHWRRIIFGVCLLVAGVVGTRADNAFIQEPLRVLLPSDLGTLEALLVRPNAPGRYRCWTLSAPSGRPLAR
jgi:hypothetical protein